MTADNLHFHKHRVSRGLKELRNNHKSRVIWFTGLSGSGKSTVANATEKLLHDMGLQTYILDGDNIRSCLNSDLDFYDEVRHENIRRISEAAKLFIDSGLIAITAFISPFRKERDLCRHLLDNNEFVEIFLDCPLAICEQRDVKDFIKSAISKLKNLQELTLL